MKQWVRQRWALAIMERKLRASEPKLTAMFTMFAWLASDEAPSGAEAMSHRRRRRRLWPYALVASVAMALFGLGVALPKSPGPSCGLAGFPPGATTSSTPATCRLPAHHAAIPQLGGRK
jgi:hypothetical protein